MQKPVQSPNPNVIENLSAILDQNVRQHQISNKNDLITVLKKQWVKITPQTLKRLKAVLEQRGGHTKF